VKITPQERDQWHLTDTNLQEAVRSLQVSGFVVLEQALSGAKVSRLLSEFLDIFDRYVADIGDNRGKARQGGVPLPIEHVFADPDVVANPMVLQVIRALLGEDVVCSYFSSDTPLPGSEYQPIHRDGKELFPGVPVTVPPFMYELNIPLVDFRSDNGPVEVWPRTHLVNNFSLLDQRRDQLRAGNGRPTVTTDTGKPVVLLGSDETHSDVQRFASDIPGHRVLMPAGSFLIRDPRMWHRGTPNRSDAARPMLSLAYNRTWYRFNAVTLSRRTYETWPADVQELFRLACIEGELSREFA
jgi:ectoine hydroxylase-related dioxygenase (phytanoyl-CoA dioxygenase family)